MSRQPRLPDLASTELDVMKVLWKEGRLSAREVHDRVEEPLGWAYSTTRTTLERLAKKGAVSKARFHGLSLYEPEISKASGLARRVLEFAERVLESDPAPVVSLFAQSEALSEAEIEELSRLLDGADREEA